MNRRCPTCLHLLRAYGEPAPTPPAPPDARLTQLLSQRERDVAGLVALGCTDHEIARLLHLARRTVSNHLGRIYARTGLRGRAHLVALIDRERDEKVVAS